MLGRLRFVVVESLGTTILMSAYILHARVWFYKSKSKGHVVCWRYLHQGQSYCLAYCLRRGPSACLPHCVPKDILVLACRPHLQRVRVARLRMRKGPAPVMRVSRAPTRPLWHPTNVRCARLARTPPCGEAAVAHRACKALTRLVCVVNHVHCVPWELTVLIHLWAVRNVQHTRTLRSEAW